MEEKLRAILKDLGLGELEIKFYLASLIHGSASIGELAKKTNIDRSTAYFIADELKNKGFIEEDFKKYKKQIFVKEPNHLLAEIKKNREKFSEYEKDVVDLMPQLAAGYTKGDFKPVLRFYKGPEGFNEIRNDILTSKISEILLYSNQKASEKVFSHKDTREFIKKRMENHIKIKVIAISQPEAKQLFENDKKELRVSKLLPKGVEFSAETYIYGDKVAMLDHTTEFIGFIVKSREFAHAQRIIFQTLWNSLK